MKVHSAEMACEIYLVDKSDVTMQFQPNWYPKENTNNGCKLKRDEFDTQQTCVITYKA